MLDFITHLDKPAAWLVAVVAGLGALGWLLKKARAAYKAVRPWARRAATVIDLAEYELQHNGGGSLKDMAARIPTLQVQMQRINDQWAEHLRQAEGRDQAIAEMRATMSDDAANLERVTESVVEIQEAVASLADGLPEHND